MTGDGFSRRTFLHGSAAAGAVTVLGTAAANAAVPGFYNPFTGYAVTGSWQEHINRGSLGGIDYGMGVGTRLPAAGGGIVTNIPDNGTGGHTVTIQHDNGYRTQYMHLSGFLLGNGTRVGRGGVVGLSGGAPGAPGSGNSDGPHLHWHMINPGGTRINPLTYLGSGGGGLPKTTTEHDGIPGAIMWKRTQNWLRLEQGYTGPIDGAPGTNTYAALQRGVRAHGYTGPIDGVMGTNSWAGVQRLASHWGYAGPIDGVMGPNSWRGFARFVNQDKYD